eukprot:m.196604 g.196604  ORF g.196604 m.196604 type:complete len:593 (-) comp19861_c0_seq1:52-1830(-)
MLAAVVVGVALAKGAVSPQPSPSHTQNAPPASSGIPPALRVSFPLAYIQSAFVSGHRNGIMCDSSGTMRDATLSDADRLDHLRRYASASTTSFRGGEMFINTMETEEALLDVRAMNKAILQVANETGTPPFYGFWIPSRLPGMWWPQNYTRQPGSYRAKALMSNGSMWVQYPTDCSVGTSILNLQGTDLDITNAEAVGLAMTNLGRVLRADCTPQSECTGPLVGSYLFSEAALAPPYLPFATYPYANKPSLSVGNVSDLQPQRSDGQAPLLRMGNASTLYRDDKVVFSFYQGPKRTAPLFSESARDSFVRYCAAHGRTNVTTLPADRGEFNDNDATVSLPPHVTFVDMNDTQLWSLWEDWVMQTWFDYCETIVTTVNTAQKGNPYFGGAFSFQLAGWYAIRARASQPVTYQWRDMNGTLQTTANEVLAQWEHYDDLNPVTKGQDLEMFADADWFTGFIHEASHGVPAIGVDPPMIQPREVRDRFIMASDRHRHFVNAQGTLAREIMAKRGKVFGAFARAAFISDPTFHGPSVADTLSVAGFAQMWNYSTSLLDPRIVSSLNDARFVPLSDGAHPPLHDIFEQLFRTLKPTSP